MSPIALLSVSDKTGLIPLAKALVNELGFKIISSGGTAKLIESENLPVTRVADYTGFPEILGGRVKTLNPKIHGGILARRDKQSHIDDLNKQNINPIDLVVVNLYPFEKTISKENVSWEEAIENIDIGGPTMIRAAAKNHQDVLVVTDPSQYSNLIDAYKSKKISSELRKYYSQQAFEHTAIYDLTISKWIANQIHSEKASWLQSLPLKQELRYGENPHQNAIWYGEPEKGWSGAHQLQGKELSTNNLLDLEAALSTLREFGYENTIKNDSYQKAAVVIKHTNPCGVAIGYSPSSALKKALDGDRVSAFGGIIAINCPVDEATAKELEETKEALKAVQTELNEVNLLNSKLLYVNRIFKANQLDESQKLRVVESLDKAGTAKEAKLIYETIKDTFNITKDEKRKTKSSIKEGLGMASKAAGTSTAPKNEIISESKDMVSRFQKLANIKINE